MYWSLGEGGWGNGKHIQVLKWVWQTLKAFKWWAKAPHDNTNQHIQLPKADSMQFSYIRCKWSDPRPICTMSGICNPTNTSVKNTLPSGLCVWTPWHKLLNKNCFTLHYITSSPQRSDVLITRGFERCLQQRQYEAQCRFRFSPFAVGSAGHLPPALWTAVCGSRWARWWRCLAGGCTRSPPSGTPSCSSPDPGRLGKEPTRPDTWQQRAFENR